MKDVIAYTAMICLGAGFGVLATLGWMDLPPPPGQQYEVAALDESGLKIPPKLTDYLMPSIGTYEPVPGQTDIFFFLMRPEINLEESIAQVAHGCEPIAYEMFWYEHEIMFESGAWSLEKMGCIQIRVKEDVTWHPFAMKPKNH